MLAEFSVIPLGRGARIGKEVAMALRIVDGSGLAYKVHSMGTLVEGNLDEILAVVKRCHQEVATHCERVLTSLRIDDRRDLPKKMKRSGKGPGKRARKDKEK